MGAVSVIGKYIACKNIIGTKYILNNEQEVTVVDYIDTKNIHIQFDNGDIYKTSTESLKSGTVPLPSSYITNSEIIDTDERLRGYSSVIFEKDYMQKDGHKVKILSIDNEIGRYGYTGKILYDVGVVKDNVVLHKVLDGTTNYLKYYHIGELKEMNNGDTLKILEKVPASKDYYKYEVVGTDKTFPGSYKSFKAGSLSYQSYIRTQEYINKTRVGERKQMSNGEWCEIIDYVNSAKITVRFDDNTIKDTDYKSFKNKTLTKVTKNQKAIDAVNKVLNKTITMNNGMKATCIKYYSKNNITVKFENKKIRENVSASAFLKGEVTDVYLYDIAKSRIGEERIMNNNKVGKIVDATDSDHLIVECDNKKKVMTYQRFISGQFLDKTERAIFNRKSLIGEKCVGKYGLSFEIIDVDVRDLEIDKKGKGKYDISIRWEDEVNQTITSLRYNENKAGTRCLVHPNLSGRNKDRVFHGYKIIGQVLEIDGDYYFKTENISTGERGIMTPRMMIDKHSLE